MVDAAEIGANRILTRYQLNGFLCIPSQVLPPSHLSTPMRSLYTVMIRHFRWEQFMVEHERKPNERFFVQNLRRKNFSLVHRSHSNNTWHFSDMWHFTFLNNCFWRIIGLALWNELEGKCLLRLILLCQRLLFTPQALKSEFKKAKKVHVTLWRPPPPRAHPPRVSRIIRMAP